MVFRIIIVALVGSTLLGSPKPAQAKKKDKEHQSH